MNTRKFPTLFRSIGLLLLISLTSCKTTGLGEVSTSSQEISYNIFWDQHDHLKELIEAKNFAAAEKLFTDHEEFFLKIRKNFSLSSPSLRTT